MSKKPIYFNDTDSLNLIISLFERTHIGGAPVLDANGEYVGVISKSDLVGSRFLMMIRQHENIDALTARDLMNTNPVLWVDKNASIEEAAAMMLEAQVHRLFVKSASGRLLGVISSFDVMKAVNAPEPAATHPTITAPPAMSALGALSPGQSEAASQDSQDKDPPDKDKELERRIYNLIARKQNQANWS